MQAWSDAGGVEGAGDGGEAGGRGRGCGEEGAAQREEEGSREHCVGWDGFRQVWRGGWARRALEMGCWVGDGGVRRAVLGFWKIGVHGP